MWSYFYFKKVTAHFGYEVTTDSAAAPLIVIKALHGYGGLTFAQACKVLIYEFSKMYHDCAKLAKIVSVFLCTSQFPQFR